jgi:hypothetical protein
MTQSQGFFIINSTYSFMKDNVIQTHITFSHLVPTININKKMKSSSLHTSIAEAMKKGCKLLVDFIDHIHTMKLILKRNKKKSLKLLFHVRLQYSKIICMIKSKKLTQQNMVSRYQLI